MDTFLGQGATFWTALGSIAVCIYTVSVLIALGPTYYQLKTTAKSHRLDVLCRLQELVDSFREERSKLFRSLPLGIALSQEQFPSKPPGRWYLNQLTVDERQRIELKPDQATLLKSLEEEDFDCVRRVVAGLNDIGQLVEDHIVDRDALLGKYHVMIIQCCHMIEAPRREIEKRSGGNYGQRVLRMRHWATSYNDIVPKHRAAAIYIRNGSEKLLVYKSPSPQGFQRFILSIRFWLGLF